MKQQDSNGEWQSQFTYDRLDQVTSETNPEENIYLYDTLGNCLKKNGQSRTINALNQVVADDASQYTYDANGNLIAQTNPSIIYQYDALNRLIRLVKDNEETTFIYDAFGRCLQITNAAGTKHLLYQGEQEIGSLFDGELDEFRLVHKENTIAIELQGQVFFPIQDQRYYICALQNSDGTLAQSYRYDAFQEQPSDKTIESPWRFANRREVAGLSLFTHRFYHPTLMRWLTTDPLGFEDGANLYRYVQNNSFKYIDPDGRVVFMIQLAYIGCTAGAAAFTIALPTLTELAVAATIAWGCNELYKTFTHKDLDITVNAETATEETPAVKEEGKTNPGDVYAPDRPLPMTPNGVPIPESVDPHTQLGTKDGTRGKYPKAREYGKDGEHVRDIDFTDHGYPHNHTNPHQHRAKPNKTGGTPSRVLAEPLPGWNYI